MITSIDEHNPKPTVVKEKLDIEKTNWSEWAEDLEQTVNDSDTNSLNSEDPSNLWEHLVKKIHEVNNRHCKMKRVTSHSKPYWTPKLTILCNRMRKAYLK